MHDLISEPLHIPTMTAKALCQVYDLEAVLLALNPTDTLKVQHVLHAGMYARTICVPADIMITGALIKIPTVVIVYGDCLVTLGDGERRFTGYHVLPASAGRKQVFRAITDTFITMTFPTTATTVAEAEREFTDDFQNLASHRDGAENETIITGEAA